MEQPNRFWFLKNPYAWMVLILGIVTAVLIQEAWVVLVGVIGYQFALLVDLTRGQSLGRSGRIKLARLEQEYRELKAEQVRLFAAIEERDRKLAGLPGKEPVQDHTIQESVDQAVEAAPLEMGDQNDGEASGSASPVPLDPLG